MQTAAWQATAGTLALCALVSGNTAHASAAQPPTGPAATGTAAAPIEEVVAVCGKHRLKKLLEQVIAGSA